MRIDRKTYFFRAQRQPFIGNSIRFRLNISNEDRFTAGIIFYNSEFIGDTAPDGSTITDISTLGRTYITLYDVKGNLLYNQLPVSNLVLQTNASLFFPFSVTWSLPKISGLIDYEKSYIQLAGLTPLFDITYAFTVFYLDRNV